ncbi:1,4-alpha-glucan branching enzyme [Olsenella profusa]|uniref:1,4-alpha-glucan branching enzyme n=1 Tax=Olsenella profusa TaxID=138595 RepID=A0ABS2F030_9ACTN|nr:1,4-alpha-glucan branching enzyme [Olsenella profusa]
MDLGAFYTGQDFEAWRWMGARPTETGTDFRVFAPAAAGVVVRVGDGAATHGAPAAHGGPAPHAPTPAARDIPMARALNGSFFEAHVPGVGPGTPYEYVVYLPDGSSQAHADPYALASELRPAHRSLVHGLPRHEFADDAWMAARSAGLDRPLNVYELHLGSWRKPGPEPDAWYAYDELAAPLAEHVRSLGCTHVELMPLSEYPFDGSWGYQATGFFSPTRRYGTPEQLASLVDQLHQAGVGVIVDFVPAHFAVDAWGLATFDGTALYEYPNDAVGVSEWGSHNFMHSRGEVRSLLQSAANLWLSVYHVDALRMDAVSRVVFWQGDERRGVNGLGVDFLRTMNHGLHERNPGCVLVAEDSSPFPGVTRAWEEGGLGFDYKWDLGWMNDVLSYFQASPEERRERPGLMTFSMLYRTNERYLLPLSHDEVVHGKATIAQKMHGNYGEKFPQARALYLWMFVHPGKKLDFMGNELAQLREWDETREQDWELLAYPVHDAFLRFRRELGRLYRAHPALWERDFEEGGAEWLDCSGATPCCWALLRRGGDELVTALLNLDDEPHDYAVALPAGEAVDDAEVLLDTDWERFGGATPDGEKNLSVAAGTLRCALAPLSGVLVRLAPAPRPGSLLYNGSVHSVR